MDSMDHNQVRSSCVKRLLQHVFMPRELPHAADDEIDETGGADQSYPPNLEVEKLAEFLESQTWMGRIPIMPQLARYYAAGDQEPPTIDAYSTKQDALAASMRQWADLQNGTISREDLRGALTRTLDRSSRLRFALYLPRQNATIGIWRVGGDEAVVSAFQVAAFAEDVTGCGDLAAEFPGLTVKVPVQRSLEKVPPRVVFCGGRVHTLRPPWRQLCQT